MRIIHGRLGLLSAGAGLLLLTACQQTTRTQTSPGALPEPPTAAATPVETQKINPTTVFAAAHLLERQGQFEKAAAQYRQALEAQPNFVAARNRLGITLNKLGRHTEASYEFLKALELQPQHAYLQNNLGFSLYLEERYQDALEVFERALAIKPDFPRAKMNHALTLAKLGRPAEAFAEMRTVTNEADAYFNIGVLLTEAGDYGEAARNLENALKLRPEFEAARRELREVARLAAGRGGLPESSTRPKPEMLSARPIDEEAEPVSTPNSATLIGADETPVPTDAEIFEEISRKHESNAGAVSPSPLFPGAGFGPLTGVAFTPAAPQLADPAPQTTTTLTTPPDPNAATELTEAERCELEAALPPPQP